MISTSGFQYTKRHDGHPLATGDEYRNDILSLKSLSGNECGNAVADGIYFCIGVLMVFEDHGNVLRGQLGLALKERYDGLGVVIVGIVLVEGVERGHL